MRVENTEVILTIPIPVDRPDKNGVVYTKEAIEKAVNNLHANLPIVYQDNKNDEKVIGTTTGKSCIVSWDSKNQVCQLTMSGVVFYSGAKIIVNEIENGKITDCEIASIGLTI